MSLTLLNSEIVLSRIQEIRSVIVYTENMRQCANNEQSLCCGMMSSAGPQLSRGVWAQRLDGETVRRFQDCLQAFPNGFVRIMPYGQVTKRLSGFVFPLSHIKMLLLPHYGNLRTDHIFRWSRTTSRVSGFQKFLLSKLWDNRVVTK